MHHRPCDLLRRQEFRPCELLRRAWTSGPAISFLRLLPARDKNCEPNLIWIGDADDIPPWLRWRNELAEPRVARTVDPQRGLSFGQAHAHTAHPRVALHHLRPRCTIGHTTFRPSFSLPVGCHPTLVPEVGEVRFLRGTEPRQVDKGNDPQRSLSKPKVQPQHTSEVTRIL